MVTLHAQERQLVGDVQRGVAAADDEGALDALQLQPRLHLDSLDEVGGAVHTLALLTGDAQLRVRAEP